MILPDVSERTSQSLKFVIDVTNLRVAKRGERKPLPFTLNVHKSNSFIHFLPYFNQKLSTFTGIQARKRNYKLHIKKIKINRPREKI